MQFRFAIYIHSQWMRLSSIMPVKLISLFQMGGIIWQMLVSPSVLSFWFHSEVSVTIWLNGAVQEYGMYLSFTSVATSTIYSNLSYVSPSNPKELFNLRHASARNVIEHIFGILKRQFCILLFAPEYDMDIQARIPPALCALHDFIRKHDPADIEDYTDMTDISHIRADDPGVGELAMHALTAAERESADAKRDQISQAMWDSYQEIVRNRGDPLLSLCRSVMYRSRY